MSSLIVRAAVVNDADAINRIYNYYIANTAITFDLEKWNKQQREDWLQQFAEHDNPYHALVAELNGTVVGFAYNTKLRTKDGYLRSTETTIYTTAEPPTQKPQIRGIGTALYKSLFEHIEKTDLHRAFAAISLPNPPSIEFHQRFGFVRVGTLTEVGYKFDQYVDIAWYEKKLK